jgi:hypothetical protein
VATLIIIPLRLKVISFKWSLSILMSYPKQPLLLDRRRDLIVNSIRIRILAKSQLPLLRSLISYQKSILRLSIKENTQRETQAK